MFGRLLMIIPNAVNEYLTDFNDEYAKNLKGGEYLTVLIIFGSVALAFFVLSSL